MKKVLIFALIFLFLSICSCANNTTVTSSVDSEITQVSSNSEEKQEELGRVIFESRLLDENYIPTQEAVEIVKILDEHAQKLLKQYDFEGETPTEKITINGGVYSKIPLINTKQHMQKEFQWTFCENVFTDTPFNDFEESLNKWFYEVNGKLYKFEDVSFPSHTGFWDLENADILVEKGKITVSTTISRNEKLNGEFTVVFENGRWKLDKSYFTFGSEN